MIVSVSERAQPEDPHRQERRLRAELDDDERNDEHRGSNEQADRLCVRPAVLGRAGHGVHQHHQSAGDRSGSSRVEVAMVEVGAALTQEYRAQCKHEQADRDVDEEDPRPAEGARQRAPEKHTGRTAAAGHGTPDAERLIALPAFAEQRGQHRESRGRDERGAQSLQRAEHDQRPLGPREPVEQGADGEEEDPGDEEPAAP